MIIQTAVICDAATDYHGKLNLLGAFDTVFVPKLPAVHPQFAIALRIVFERIEEGQHRLKLNFVDEDGKLYMRSMDVPVNATIPPESNFITRNFILNIQNLEFVKAGSYAVEIAADNHHLISIPLSVKVAGPQGQLPAPPAPPPSGPYQPPTSGS